MEVMESSWAFEKVLEWIRSSCLDLLLTVHTEQLSSKRKGDIGSGSINGKNRCNIPASLWQQTILTITAQANLTVENSIFYLFS